MSAKFRIEWNSDGFKQILQSDEMRAAVESQTEEIANRAQANVSDGVEVYKKVQQGTKGRSSRWIGIVSVLDREETENKALTRAMG